MAYPEEPEVEVDRCVQPEVLALVLTEGADRALRFKSFSDLDDLEAGR